MKKQTNIKTVLAAILLTAAVMAGDVTGVAAQDMPAAPPADAAPQMSVAPQVSTAPANPNDKRHAELIKFEEQGGSVTYIGHAYGLDGWLLTKEGTSPQTAYTNDQGGLVLGPLVNPEGIVETANQLAAYKAKAEGRSQEALPGADQAKAAPSEKFYAEVEKANWIQVGQDDAPYIYMTMNVTCDHCQKYWKDLQGAIDDGKLQIRLIPFGAVAANREGGAALLSAENPRAAWNAFIAGDKNILAAANAKPGTLEKIDANGQLLNKWKVKDTPFTIYRRLNDGAVTVIAGRPQNALLVMADLIR